MGSREVETLNPRPGLSAYSMLQVLESGLMTPWIARKQGHRHHHSCETQCPCCRNFGRKITMLAAGLCFCAGAVLTAAAYHLPQLVVGRVVLGFGVGELTAAAPWPRPDVLAHQGSCALCSCPKAVPPHCYRDEGQHDSSQRRSGELPWRGGA